MASFLREEKEEELQSSYCASTNWTIGTIPMIISLLRPSMKESIKETMDWLIFLGPQQIHKDGQKSPFEAGEGEKRWQRETKIEKLVEKSMQV